MKRIANRRGGFVLVMTLFIIALCGVLLVGLANHSLNLVSDTLVYEQELQTKWGAASCQRFAFSNSVDLLGGEVVRETTGGLPRPPERSSGAVIALGRQTFRIAIADESSKLDVNNLIWRRSAEESEAVVRALALGPWRPALQPLSPELQRDSKEDPFECWEQVFERPVPFNVEDLLLATSDLTCWSSRLCLQSASDRALAATAELCVGPIQARKLVELRREQPQANVSALILQLDAPQGRLDQLSQILADGSHSQSVLVTITGVNVRRTCFVVRESFGRGLSRYSGFAW